MMLSKPRKSVLVVHAFSLARPKVLKWEGLIGGVKGCAHRKSLEFTFESVHSDAFGRLQPLQKHE